MNVDELEQRLERLYREKPEVFRRLSSIMRLPEPERMEALRKLLQQ